MTEAEVKAYMDFMYNPKNEFECDKCPENHNFDSWQGRFPCGQWNCWVTCHCKTLSHER